MASTIKNTADLRKMLLEVIDDVRMGNIDYRDANAIGSLSSQILKSAKLDFDAMQAGGERTDRQIQSVLLTGGESTEDADAAKPVPRPPKKLPAATLSEEQRNKILALKGEGKPLHVVCDALRAAAPGEKKLVAAVYYGKTEPDAE